jgi:hypothetical protein
MAEMWEILVPTVFNDGRPIRTRYHRKWDEKVRALTGGMTILPAAKGQWVSSDGNLFKERMIPVRIMTERKTMQEIAQMTMDHYEQLAVMVYRVSDDAFIVNADPDMTAAWKSKNKIGMKDYSWLENTDEA